MSATGCQKAFEPEKAFHEEMLLFLEMSVMPELKDINYKS